MSNFDPSDPSFDPSDMLRYSASHPDPSCLHMALQAHLAGIGLVKKFKYCQSAKQPGFRSIATS